MTGGDLARKDVVTVEPTASVAGIVEAMRANGVGSVVVEADGDPVGIVTLDDFVALLPRKLPDLGGIIAAGSPAYPYDRPSA